MEKIDIEKILLILKASEKSFNNMIDWHIAAFQERDSKRRKMFYAIYEIKRKEYYELMKKLWRENGQ